MEAGDSAVALEAEVLQVQYLGVLSTSEGVWGGRLTVQHDHTVAWR